MDKPLSVEPGRARARGRARGGAKDRDGPRDRVGGGLLPTTSHSIFYSRVGQIAIFSHCQP